jgi:hypothetical protein
VALVMSFSTDGSLDMRPSNGVLKVLKPNVQEQLEEELEIWSDLAAFVDERRECDGLPLLRSTEIFQTVRELLANEVRLDLEQLHLEEAARFYADSDKIQIPVVLRYSTPRITASGEWSRSSPPAPFSQRVRRGLIRSCSRPARAAVLALSCRGSI